MKKKYLTLIIFLVPILVAAQVGGQRIYQFLNLSPSARVSGLAGNLITVRDNDLALALANPGALNKEMHNHLTFNHSLYVADISHGFVGYGRYLNKQEITAYAGIQYINYGDFDATDNTGIKTGTFNVSEYAFAVGAGKQLYEKMSVGANIKFITSRLESYKSAGMAMDLSAMYFDTTKNFTATLLFKNIGFELATYREGNREKLPFEMQIGISKRLAHLPLRFSFIYHHLQRWNILYDDPNEEQTTILFGETNKDSAFKIWSDNLLRHFIFNAEFLLGKKGNLRLRAGYNHFRHKEMSVNNFRSTAGFSFGFGFKINRFRIDYGRSALHLAGGLNHFSISTNLNEFKRNKMP